MVDKIMKHLAWIAYAGFLYLVGVGIYWYTWPYDIIDIAEPIKVYTKQVQQGEYLQYKIVYTKHKALVGTRQIQLMNSATLILNEPSISNLPVGTNVVFRESFQIPRHLPAGYYYFTKTIQHKPNPIRTVTESFKSEEFEVVEKKQ